MPQTHLPDEIIEALQAAIARRDRLRPRTRDQWRATCEVRALQHRLVAVLGEGRPTDGQPSESTGRWVERPMVPIGPAEDVADLVQSDIVPGKPTFVTPTHGASDV